MEVKSLSISMLLQLYFPYQRFESITYCIDKKPAGERVYITAFKADSRVNLAVLAPFSARSGN